jgi:hypothetical protein
MTGKRVDRRWLSEAYFVGMLGLRFIAVLPATTAMAGPVTTMRGLTSGKWCGAMPPHG